MKQLLSYLLVILFVAFCVLEYNDEIEAQYTFTDTTSKENYLRTIISNDSGSDESINQVIAELAKVPENILLSFLKTGGKIQIIDLDHKFVAGSFDTSIAGNYIIKIEPEYADYATLHEIGHYFARINHIENDARFKQCLQEKEKAVNTIFERNRYFYDDSEYFAEMFKYYCNGDLNEYEFPLTVGYLEILISEF